jgi:hypothetical protein
MLAGYRYQVLVRTPAASLRPGNNHERLTCEIRFDPRWSAPVVDRRKRDLLFPAIEDDLHPIEVKVSPTELPYQFRPTARHDD